MWRCGSQASPLKADGPAAATSSTSRSPTFSSVTPGLIQVLTAQSLCPQGSMRTRALPSPLAHSPKAADGAVAAPAPARVTSKTPNAIALLMTIVLSTSRLLNKNDRQARLVSMGRMRKRHLCFFWRGTENRSRLIRVSRPNPARRFSMSFAAAVRLASPPLLDPLTLVERSRRLPVRRPEAGFPIAINTDAASAQRCAAPPDLFRLILGPRVKCSFRLYSRCRLKPESA